MRKYFITYADGVFEESKSRLLKEAEALGEFDEIIGYGREDITDELRNTDIINIKRGGGLWSWKPDVVYTTLNKMNENDILVYCDSGCVLQDSLEWKKFWFILERYDYIAQRIYQKTENWTRKEILDKFVSNGKFWHKFYQFQGGILIFKKTSFTFKLIEEWRSLIINYPELIKDVTDEERRFQHDTFIENRHDQAIYSALLYSKLSDNTLKSRVYVMWEHVEDYDIFNKQAIRAARIKSSMDNEKSKMTLIIKKILKDLYKNIIVRPNDYFYRLLNKIYR